MQFDRYTIFAQIIPAVLCSIPIVLLLHFHVPDIALLENYGALLLAGTKLAPSVLFIYPLVKISRFVGKCIEEHWFGEELFFPTTDLLLYKDNTLSRSSKGKIRNILSSFDYQLSTLEEELEDETTARKRIVEAMSFIRARVGRGIHVHDYNIHYGFWRNIIGGSTIALTISVLELAVIFFDNDFLPLQLVLMITISYLLILLVSRWLIKGSAKRYARVLLNEFRILFSGAVT